jgi:hypothetical protein
MKESELCHNLGTGIAASNYALGLTPELLASELVSDNPVATPLFHITWFEIVIIFNSYLRIIIQH